MIQVALVISGFVIRGFDSSRPVSCVQNSLSADIYLDYLRISTFLMGKTALKGLNSGPLLFAVLVFAGYSWDLTPANNEGHLYSVKKQRSFFELQKKIKTSIKYVDWDKINYFFRI